MDVNGIRIHWLEAGSARAGDPALLMVHGWAGAAADWERLLPALPPGLRSFAVDLPGFGLSDKPDAPYDIPFFLDVLRSFLAAHGLSRVVLVGHSMGGQIAVHFTVRFPGLVEKVVLIDPYGLKGEEGSRRFLARLGQVVDLAFLLNTRFFIERAMRANVLHDPPDDLVAAAVESTAAGILGREWARAMSRITRRVIGTAYVDALLPGLSQETLLIWGEQDRLLPPHWADAFAARLRRVTVHRIPGTGHMPMLEKPEVVAGLIADFVNR